MVSSTQYFLVFNLGPRPIWPKAQHFPKWLHPQIPGPVMEETRLLPSAV